MKQENNLGRAWDRFDVYLFDIDGTLIECTDATHYFAFCEALKTLSGRSLNLDGVVAQGNTDVGILRDALGLAGVREEEWRNRLPEVRASMGRFVEERKDELCTTVLPGVRKVLEHLQRVGAKLGVATGNLEQIGKLKLERAGLLGYFDFGGWSDNYEYRKDVFQSAVERARNLYGAAASMCILGDTPADVQAAHAVGLPVIAIATGIFSREQLMEANPEVCVPTFDSLLQ
jgi:phosphoglycolate phosphatase-like HAD superfamily hydrolase